MTLDTPRLYQMLQDAVTATDGARVAWEGVMAAIDATGHRVPPRVRDVPITDAVAEIANQLRTVVRQEPIPADISFLYFGLYTSWQPPDGPEGAGFYLAGAEGGFEDALEGGTFLYRPEAGGLESALLHAIKEVELADEDDSASTAFGWGLMLGAAGILARFAADDVGLPYPVIVGFDDGDFMKVH